MSKLIPEAIQVGCYELKILRESPVVSGSDRCLGKHDPETFLITIDDSSTEQQQSGTFIHEVLEAISSVYSLNLPHDQLSIIAVSLTQALQPIWKEKNE